eukprot:GEMP01000327.1.p1 GENE.GEMP01000327.1~~GEMP01000327.1.p1  ORF type:complete len:2210 (+),score=447.18 GEMP01000327.1:732-7361(+)
MDAASYPGNWRRSCAVKRSCRKCQAWQIRYCGHGFVCKGVLVVDMNMKNSHEIHFRPSMRKVPTTSSNTPEESPAAQFLQLKLGVLSWSRRMIGKLNKQLVALLSATVGEDVLRTMHKEHITMMKMALKDPVSTAKCFALTDQWSTFVNLLRDMDYSDRFPGHPARRLSSDRIRMPIAYSRMLLGASVPELVGDNILEEGQCVVFTEHGVLTGSVLVSRSPSYSPGDIRVLQAVSLPNGHAMANLRNCILFATQGKRSDPDKMSGGDLDGDLYLVLWDKCLLDAKERIMKEPPVNYDPPQPHGASPKCYDEDWIRYVARWDNAMLCRIDKCFFEFAAMHGVKSAQCEELCSLFSRAVDQHPADLDRLRTLQRQSSPNPAEEPIWDIMEREQNQASVEVKTHPFFTRKQWQAWHERLCRADVTSGDHIFKALLSERELKTAHVFWGKLSRSASTRVSHRKQLRDLADARKSISDSAVATDVCTFDCVDYTCRRMHPKLDVCHEKWLARATTRRREDEKVKDVQNKIEVYRDQITTQAKLLGDDDRRIYEKIRASKATYEEAKKCLDSLCRQVQWPVLWIEPRLSAWMRGILVFMLPSYAMYYTQYEAVSEREQEHRTVTQKAAEERRSLICGETAQALENELGATRSQIEKLEIRREALEGEINRVQRQLEQCEQIIAEMDVEVIPAWERLKSMSAKKQSWWEWMTHPSVLSVEWRKHERCLEQQKEALRVALCSVKQHCPDFWRPPDGASSCVDQWIAFLQSKRRLTKESKTQLISERSGVDTELTHYRTASKECKSRIELTYQPQKESCALESIVEEESRLRNFELGFAALEQEISNAFYSATLAKKRRLRAAKSLSAAFVRERARVEETYPIWQMRGALVNALTRSDIVVVTADTGSGKSTQLPQYLADDLHHTVDFGSGTEFPRIVCTQPRRLAAQNIAKRVATEYGGAVGDLVGYRVGARGGTRDHSNKCVSPHTRIEFVTEGLLLNNLRRNEVQYQCVVIDEAHERGQDTDLLLALMRKLLLEPWKADQMSKRPALCKVIVMSASINAEHFANYFGCCPVIKCPGQMHSVEIIYRPLPRNDEAGDNENNELKEEKDSLDKRQQHDNVSRDSTSSDVDCAVIDHAVRVLFRDVVPESTGDVLIFLPGQREILECVAAIHKHAKATSPPCRIVAYPLYAKLAQEEQDRALDERDRWEGSHPHSAMAGVPRPNHGGRDAPRKVVCCTNIAETSLTIPLVRFVIDTGRAKQMTYDHDLRVSTLSTIDISQAAATQRKGRAGRVSSGWCYRLYSEEHYTFHMEEYEEPEMRRAPVDKLMLYALDKCGDMEGLHLLDPPEQCHMEHAKRRLEDLEFITTTSGTAITPDGRVALQLADFDLEAVRMLIAAQKHGCVYHALQMAALLKHQKNFFVREPRSDAAANPKSDRATSGVNGAIKSVEKHLKYVHEMGDHFTLMALFKAFEAEKKNAVARVWCEALGLSYEGLEQVQATINCTYDMLKRDSMLGQLGATKFSGIEPLGRAIVAGYFHNVAVLHDEALVEAGYSVLSPLPRKGLLKVLLGRSSALSTHGNVLTNTMVIYGALYRPARTPSKCFMEVASRINPEWVRDHASERWLKAVSFDALENTVIKEIVPRVGREILKQALLWKVGTVTANVCQQVESDTNAVVKVLCDLAEIRCYGSRHEVNAALEIITRALDETRREFRAKTSKYPRRGPLEFSCTVAASMQITHHRGNMWAERMDEWDRIESRRVIFFNQPVEGEKNIRCQIAKALHDDSPDRIKNIRCNNKRSNDIDMKPVTYFVEMDSMASAKEVVLSDASGCRLDNVVRIEVWETSLYPSVEHFAGDEPFVSSIDIKTIESSAFQISPKKMNRRRTAATVADFLLKLQEKCVLGSVYVGGIDFGDTLVEDNKPFVQHLLEQWCDKATALCRARGVPVHITCQVRPTPYFEVFGEPAARTLAAESLRISVREFDEAKLNLFQKKRHLKRFELGVVGHGVEDLRSKHKDALFCVQVDGSTPTVEVTSPDKKKCAMAWEALLTLLKKPEGEDDGNTGSASTCVACGVLVRGKNFWPLTLCGCVYCAWCLTRETRQQLNGPKSSAQCVGADGACRSDILPRDCERNLKPRTCEDLYVLAYRNYLRSTSSELDVVGECVACETPMLFELRAHAESGAHIFRCRNTKCHRVFCFFCLDRVHNEIDFAQHEECWSKH